MSFIRWRCERRAKFQVAKEISGRGRRRRRNEKGNQGVGDFRFINIVQMFSIYYCFFILSFFLYLFLPTTFTHTHTHDPRPLPTTHDPRHLATLSEKVVPFSRLGRSEWKFVYHLQVSWASYQFHVVTRGAFRLVRISGLSGSAVNGRVAMGTRMRFVLLENSQKKWKF